MDYEFKYARRTLDLIASIVYGISAIFHFSLLIFILINSRKMNLFIPLLLFVSVMVSALCILYLNIYFGRRNYLVVNEGIMFKDQGIVWPNKKVGLSDIRYTKIIGDKIRLGLGDRNELRVNLDCLNVEDITKLESILQCKIE